MTDPNQTDPNQLLWNQAVSDENWPEAQRLQRLAASAGQVASSEGVQIGHWPSVEDLEDLSAEFERDTLPVHKTPAEQQFGTITPDWDALLDD